MVFTPTVLGSGLAGYSFLTRTRDQQQSVFAQSPQIARDVDAFRTRLDSIQSADELLEDRQLLRVALGAFGLDEDIDNTAFLRQILESDLSDRTSLANRLADKRYRAFAETFNFASDAGPQLISARSEDDVAAQLAGIQTAEDLLSDPILLRSTLKAFGLENDTRNTFFLQQVLESDLSDANSFANRLSDTRYVALAEAFGLAEKTAQKDSLYGYAALVGDRAAEIRTFDDLLAAPEILEATLEIFDFEAALDRPQLFEDALTSDLNDPDSAANTADDPRYGALARLFGFAERAAAEAAEPDAVFESRLERVVTLVNSRETPIETPQEFFQDVRLMLATFDFFDLPAATNRVSLANRVLTSDLEDPASFANQFPEERYKAFARAFTFTPAPEGRVYPTGFAEQIAQNYMDRQFEISIGNVDPTMRLALSLERDLGQVVNQASSNDARWFAVMSSKPLRQVFETALQLPSSFGTLDIDRQLEDFKDRAQRFFGTENLGDFLEPDRLEELRNRFLVQDAVRTQPAAPQSSGVLSLLSGLG